jgi:PAS domain S-box-containing protein
MDNHWTTKKTEELRQIMPEFFDQDGKLCLSQLIEQLGEENISKDENQILEQLSLSASSENIFEIINKIPVPIAINEQNQSIRFVNASFIETFGYTIEDIPMLSIWWTKAYPDPEYRKFILDYWSTKLNESKKRVTSFEPTEAIIRCKNGDNKSVIASVSTIKYGQEKLDLVVLYDITTRKNAENELTESRVKYEGLSDAAFESIFISENGKCIEQNKTAANTFGYTSEEALGRFGTDWIVEEDREMVMKKMMQGVEEPYEATALKKDGTTFPCLLRGKMMLYKNKNVRITSLTDISIQKKAQLELLESNTKLKAIVDNEPECIKIVNDLGQLTFMNNAGLCTIEADSFEQVEGCNILDVISPADRDKFAQMHNRVLAGESIESDFEIIGRKGTHRWINTHAVPITIDGKVSQLAITRDVSIQKKALEAIAESEKRYKALYDASPTGIIMLDKNGIIQEINNEVTKITLFPRDELIGQSIIKLSTIDKAPLINSNIQRILNGEFLESDVETVKKDGTLAFFQLREIAITLSNGEQGILSVSNDITERKNSEKELSEKLDELTRFHRLTVGRELMMIELKKEINELLKKAGLEEKYVIVG